METKAKCKLYMHRCKVLLKGKKILDKNPKSKFRRFVVCILQVYCNIIKVLSGHKE